MAVAVEYELFLARLTEQPVSTPVPPPPVVVIPEPPPIPNPSILAWESYLRARQRSMTTGKPMVVRVGIKNDQLVDLLPEFEHVFIGEFPECDWPSVVVGVPQGLDMFRYDLPADVTPPAIKKLVGGGRWSVTDSGESSVPATQPVYQPVYQPAFVPQFRQYAGRSC